MTAPLRSHGKLVSTIQRGCAKKLRYSDEWSARAAGMIDQERYQEKMYLYPCGICRGWHLTKKVQAERWKAVDYDFAGSAQKNKSS